MNWIFFLISRNLFFYSLSFISPAFKTLGQAKRKKKPGAERGENREKQRRLRTRKKKDFEWIMDSNGADENLEV